MRAVRADGWSALFPVSAFVEKRCAVKTVILNPLGEGSSANVDILHAASRQFYEDPPRKAR